MVVNADDDEIIQNVYFDNESWFSKMCYVLQPLLRGSKYKLPEKNEVLLKLIIEWKNTWH